MREEYIGKTCPYCKTALVETDAIVVCNVCNMPHHRSCWQDHQRCATPGCTGSMEEIMGKDSTVAIPSPEATEPGQAEQTGKSPELLYESREMVFMSDVPIVLEYAAIMMEPTDGKLFACCTFRSITDRAIKAVLAEIVCQDVWGSPVGTPVTFQYLDLNTKRDAKFGQTNPIDLPDQTTRRIQVSVKKVLFTDDTMINGGDRVFTTPAPVLLSEHLGSKDLAAQYARETTAKAQFVPIGGGKYWFCTCGALNESLEPKCHNCGCTKKQLVTALNPEALQTNLIRFEAQKAQAEQAEEGVPPDKKHTKRKSKLFEDSEKSEKRRKKPAFAMMISLIVIIAVGCGVIFFGVPYFNYRAACDALNNGEYDTAYQAFLDLDGFMDSDEMALKSIYKKGEAFLDESKLDQAIATFEEIKDYEDSAERINEAKYLKACQYFENKDFTQAVAIFETISHHKNSAEMITEAKYLEACHDFENKNYTEAIAIFESISHYKDSASMITEAKYQDACHALENKKYTQAVSLFEGISYYKNSTEKIKEAKYRYVLSHKHNGNTTTYEYLLSLKSSSYKDSATIYKELYDWKITVLGWNSDRDSHDYQTSINKYRPVYCHIKLTGGTPGGSTTIHVSGKLPNGNDVKEYTFNSAWREHSEGWYGWSDGIYAHPEYGAAGTLQIDFYDDDGNKIGTASLKITE